MNELLNEGHTLPIMLFRPTLSLWSCRADQSISPFYSLDNRGCPRRQTESTTSSGCGKPTLPALWPLHGPGGRSSTGRESLDRQMVSRPPAQGSQADLTCQPREFPGKFCPAPFPHICPKQMQPRRPQLWAVLSAFIPRVLSQEARGFWG